MVFCLTPGDHPNPEFLFLGKGGSRWEGEVEEKVRGDLKV